MFRVLGDFDTSDSASVAGRDDHRRGFAGLHHRVPRRPCLRSRAVDRHELPRHATNPHRVPAAPAQHRPASSGLCRHDHDTQHQLHASQQRLAAVVQQAVVAAAPKASGQHMGEQQPEEIGAGQNRAATSTARSKRTNGPLRPLLGLCSDFATPLPLTTRYSNRRRWQRRAATNRNRC